MKYGYPGVIKISAGRYWGLMGRGRVGSNLGWARTHWAKEYIYNIAKGNIHELFVTVAHINHNIMTLRF